MPCDTRLKRGQTISQRITEVRSVVERVSQAIGAGLVKVKVGPTGAPVFIGIEDKDRDAVTDNCIYRRLLVSGSAKVRAMLSTVPVNKQAVAQGHHSHDNGATWHHHKG